MMAPMEREIEREMLLRKINRVRDDGMMNRGVLMVFLFLISVIYGVTLLAFEKRIDALEAAVGIEQVEGE